MKSLFQQLTRSINRASGSVLVRALLNARLKETAHVLKLNIDPESQTIDVEIQLKDQPGPWRIHVEGYELTSEGGQDQLRWSKLTVDGGAANLPPGIRDKLAYVM